MTNYIKYELGLTRIQDNTGAWNPVKGAWIKQADGTWAPIKTGWVKRDDGVWERIYPTPKGVFTTNIAQITANPYQHYDDTKAVLLTNTGDFDLTINSAVVNDDTTNFITNNFSIPTTPFTLVPGASTTFSTREFGKIVGNGFNGNINFTAHTGYLGYANVTYPIVVNVLPDYNGIKSNVSTVANLYYYEYENGANSIGYSSLGTYSYTVPAGVTSLTVSLTGGGGGGGSADSQPGSAGYPGHNITGTISVTTGDVITTYVGGGGTHGTSGSGTGGGSGGTSAAGYNGGNGSSAGPAGYSGSGGGGGAATVIKKNGTVIAVAGGGGGGAGGGNNVIYNNDEYGHTLSIEYGPDASGQGQGSYVSNGTIYGGNGQYRPGDGGGAGGGGGGQYGGAGGNVNTNGDFGGYAGSDGADLKPSGFVFRLGTNGGARSVSGGSGSATITEQGVVIGSAQTIQITNSGNGADLHIANIVSQNGYVSAYGLTANTIGFNFDTYTGNTAQFNIAPATLIAGTYKDTIIINSDAKNNPALAIPVTVNVIRPSGRVIFDNEGTYQWTVPNHVHYLNLFSVGGGAGGGSPLTNDTRTIQGGGGGGGGSGGYQSNQRVQVTPGEVLNISVGLPGGQGATRSVGIFYPVTNDAWGSFMNSYAVWVNKDGSSPLNAYVNNKRTFTVPAAGTYTIEARAADVLLLSIDGAHILTSQSTATSTTAAVNLAAGNRVLTMLVVNQSGAGGFAVTIKDPSSNIVWTTRTLLDSTAGLAGGATSISGSFGTITVGGGNPGSSAYEDYSPPWIASSGDGQAAAPGDQDDSGSDGGGGGGGECFTGDTLINMYDGTTRAIKDIVIGDLVTDALTGSANKVIGIKTTTYEVGRRIFATRPGETPYITEQHAWYNDDNELCAMSGECEYLAPWLGTVKIIKVPEVINNPEPVTVYNLMFETGNSHYANGLRVSNIVGTGGAYVLVYKGFMSTEDYRNFVETPAYFRLPSAERAAYFNLINRITNYILHNNNFRGRILGHSLSWMLKNSNIIKPVFAALFRSPIKSLVFRKNSK